MPLTGSGLDHLSSGEEVDQLPPGIFCADWDSRLYKSPPRVKFRQGDLYHEGQLLNFDVGIDRNKSTESYIVFRLSNELISYQATFSFDTNRPDSSDL
jgi:hypothetical protein